MLREYSIKKSLLVEDLIVEKKLVSMYMMDSGRVYFKCKGCATFISEKNAPFLLWILYSKKKVFELNVNIDIVIKKFLSNQIILVFKFIRLIVELLVFHQCGEMLFLIEMTFHLKVVLSFLSVLSNFVLINRLLANKIIFARF